jgi:hypothetical protein
VSLIIDIIFVIDIIICFRTTYVNPATGDEIWSPSMIAKYYFLNSRFWVDLISSLPLDYFTIGTGFIVDILSLVSMLKIVRITRISRIISNLNAK